MFLFGFSLVLIWIKKNPFHTSHHRKGVLKIRSKRNLSVHLSDCLVLVELNDAL